MKRGFKSLAAGCMSALVIASAISPAFAQNYGYSYGQPVTKKPATKSSTYNKGYTVPQQSSGYNLPPLQGKVTTVPQGVVINGAAPTTEISSQWITPGDTLTFVLNSPFYYGNSQVLPAGTSLQGNAVVARKGGYAGQYGQLKIVFNNATLPSGQRIPISGKIATQDRTGMLTAGTTSGRLMSVGKDAAVGAGGGALAGLIGSAIGGGKKGKAAAIGSGIGAGIGLLKSGVDKGQDVVLEAGQPIDIILDAPMTVSGGGQSYNNNNNYNNYDY